MLPPTGRTTTREARMSVGGYVIEGVLGEGGSAIVFEATDAQGQRVALKVLRPDLALSPREQQRFVEEAARLRRVQHTSIVEIVDSGVLPDGRPFIAMPRLEGRSLLDRMQSGPLRFDVALALFEQLTGALQALHAAGLVHRDIKPENIFIVEGDTRAVLLDLGIARDMGADPTTTTRAGLIRGTPAYMAPERFFGKPATPATDIYELAVVFYVVLVGALPWNAVDDPTERLRPIPPAQRGVVLPAALSDTLMRALAGQAQERPRVAAEFSAALHEAVSPASARGIVAQQTTSVRPTTQPLKAVPSSSPVATQPASSMESSSRVVPKTIVAAAVSAAPTWTSPAPIPVAPPSAAWAPAATPQGFASAPHVAGPAYAPPSPPKGRSLGVIVAAIGAVAIILSGLVLVVIVFAVNGSDRPRRVDRSPDRETRVSGEQPASTAATAVAERIEPSADLRCCRALNEALCPAPPAPCKPSVDVDSLTRTSPRFTLERLDKNCCQTLDAMKKAMGK